MSSSYQPNAIVALANIVSSLITGLHYATAAQYLSILEQCQNFDNIPFSLPQYFALPSQTLAATLIIAGIVTNLAAIYFWICSRQEKGIHSVNIGLFLIIASLSLNAYVAILNAIAATNFPAPYQAIYQAPFISNEINSSINTLYNLNISEAVVTFVVSLPCLLYIFSLKCQQWFNITYPLSDQTSNLFSQSKSLSHLGIVSILLLFNCASHFAYFGLTWAPYESVIQTGTNLLYNWAGLLFILITSIWIFLAVIANLINRIYERKGILSDRLSNAAWFFSWTSLVLNFTAAITLSLNLSWYNSLDISFNELTSTDQSIVISLWIDTFATYIFGFVFGAKLYADNMYNEGFYKSRLVPQVKAILNSERDSQLHQKN